MIRIYTCTLSLLLSCFTFAQETLLSDLETEGKQNNLGYDWYYFSDVNDSGNSVIRNVQYLGDGVYEDFAPSDQGYQSEQCARIDFILGDQVPHRYGVEFFDGAFVGMGMDIAEPGMTVDISGVEEITFYARATKEYECFMEIATGDIDNFKYLRKYFWVSDQWQKISVRLDDLDYFGGDDWLDKNASLSVAQKINWQVFSDARWVPDSGFLEIDQVSISSFPTRIKPRVTRMRKPETSSASAFYLINGRSLSGVSRNLPTAHTIYLREGRKRVFANLPNR